MSRSPFETRPALRLALLVAAGILLGRCAAIPPVIPLILLFLLLTLSVLLRRNGSMSPAGAVLLQLSVVALGCALQTFQQQRAANLRLAPETETEWISFRGVVLDTPRELETGRIVTLRAEDIRTSLRRVAGERTLQVRLKNHPETLQKLEAGMVVRCSGRLERFPAPRNPGDLDPAGIYDLRGIHGIVAADGLDVSVESPTSGFSITVQTAKARSALGALLHRFHGKEEAAFLKGILLGDRTGIEPEVRESFVVTGTMHVLAVSGLHVGVLAAALYVMLGLFRIPRTGAAAVTIVALIFYMVLTGLSPSVVRAGVMGGVILAGTFVERRTGLAQSLGLAALIILLVDSQQLFHPGFQLSFAAVFSIAYFHPRLMGLLRQPYDRKPFRKILDPAAQLLAVSLAAQIGTIPLVAQYFEKLSVIGIGVNLIVVPLVSVNVTLGFLTLLVAPLWAWVGGAFASVNNLLVGLLLEIVAFGSRVPFASFSTAAFTWLFPAVYYPSVLAIANVSNPQRFRRIVLVVAAIVTVGIFEGVAEGVDHSLRVTIIDVGQGDAILVETPRGARLLIDAGPGGFGFSAGERFIEPLLRRKGIDRLDAVLLTHPHADHIGGVSHVLENVRVGRIITSGEVGSSRTFREVNRLAQERGVPLCTARAGDTILIDPSLRAYVLFPQPLRDHARNANNMSLVLKLQYGAVAWLFPGDAEDDVEELLASRYGSFLRSNVLKVGHHGSSTSSSPVFLEAVRPEIALISVGYRNKFNHPSAAVLEALERRGAVLRRTDREGGLQLSSDGRIVRWVRWRDL